MKGRLIILNKPVVIPSIRISDDVIQDNQPLKLELQLPLQRRRERLALKLF